MRDGVNITEAPVGGVGGKIFCSSPHPTNPDVWCRKLPHTLDVACAAFVHSISEPEEWWRQASLD